MYWHGDWDWGAWIAMTASMIAFWGLVIWAIVSLVRRPPPGEPRDGQSDPESLLAERLARGEIDVADYQERLRAIREARSQHHVGG